MGLGVFGKWSSGSRLCCRELKGSGRDITIDWFTRREKKRTQTTTGATGPNTYTLVDLSSGAVAKCICRGVHDRCGLVPEAKGRAMVCHPGRYWALINFLSHPLIIRGYVWFVAGTFKWTEHLRATISVYISVLLRCIVYRCSTSNAPDTKILHPCRATMQMQVVRYEPIHDIHWAWCGNGQSLNSKITLIVEEMLERSISTYHK